MVGYLKDKARLASDRYLGEGVCAWVFRVSIPARGFGFMPAVGWLRAPFVGVGSRHNWFCCCRNGRASRVRRTCLKHLFQLVCRRFLE